MEKKIVKNQEGPIRVGSLIVENQNSLKSFRSVNRKLTESK